MDIITERVLGSNCSHYLVEVPPQRRLVFFEPYRCDLYPYTALDLPLPRMIYRVLGPSSKKSYEGGPRRAYNVEAGAALDAPYKPDANVYAVPFPNYYWENGCMFSNCAGGIPVPDDTDPHEAVEHILECWFANPFRYMGGLPKELRNWLGLYDVFAVLPEYYAKWEACSLEEVETFPWGKIAHEMTAKQLFG